MILGKLPRNFVTAVIVLAVVALLSAALAACDAIEEVTSRDTPTPVTSRPTGPPAPTTGPATDAPSPTSAAVRGTPSASGRVLPVSIAPVPADLPEYDRGTWRHWTDEDGDCQNARQEVLIAEATGEITFETTDQCRVAAGRWEGPYTGETVTTPRELDIDHLVPLENAHRSGAWRWDRERKREFANYLDDEAHLIATTSSANRSKGSKGPEAWRPPLESYWCTYATDWVTVKNRWGLSVTEAEFNALNEMLSTCESPVLLQPSQRSAPTPPAATRPPTPAAGLRYDPFGPDRDCGDFDSYDEVLAFFLAAGGPDQDRHKLDVNGDGEPCESLPGGPSAAEPTGPSQGTIALYATFPSGATESSEDCPASGQSAAGPTNSPDCAPTPASTPIAPPTAAPEATPAPSATAIPAPTPEPPPTPTPDPTPKPTPTPTPDPTPESADIQQEEFVDLYCGDFSDWPEAQSFFESQGGPDQDPHGLDGDGNGVVCQSLPGSPTDSSLSTPAPMATPVPDPELTPAAPQYAGLPFDPSGPDRNCSDFSSWWDAQNFFLAAGGPDEDPHRLDHNGDGTVCESLLPAPEEDSPADGSSQEPSPSESSSGSNEDFQDRNCGDFDTWEEANDFFLAEGGPDADPHGLDHDGDGTVCESLLPAPEEDSPADGSSQEPSTSESSSGSDEDFQDRDCGDFDTWEEANDFFLSEGGPEDDPHRLDGNNDGVPCESLPGAPK